MARIGFWTHLVRKFSVKTKPIHSIEEASRRLDITGKRDEISLKRVYALALLVGMFYQVHLANRLFDRYMAANNDNPPVQAIQIWLAATVIEVIALVVIVTRYLFPNRSQKN